MPIARRSAGLGRRIVVGLAVLVTACGVGVSISFVEPSRLLLGLLGVVLVGSVTLYPPVAVYTLVLVTPLIAGIDRGLLMPVLRPSESIDLLVAAGLIARGLVSVREGRLRDTRVTTTDVSVLAMSLAGSVLPLAWMIARGHHIDQDDILYALVMWKFFGIYLIARVSIRTERERRTCLCLALLSACIVALIAILQALQLFGVPQILATYYSPYGNAAALQNSRGGATLSLPIAEADLMIFSLAIALGFLIMGARYRSPLVIAATLCVAGVVASGEISALIAMSIALASILLVTRRASLIAWLVPGIILAAYALRPVIELRLSGFDSPSGLPVSWAGRLYNLTNYFWPQLFSNANFILGVRPAARIATSTMATGYIWIESGYTWLLWSGGIPFLVTFIYFLVANLRIGIPLARARRDTVGVAALAAVAALVVVAVLMIIDPHLTYRGSADLLFIILGVLAASIVSSKGGPTRGSARRL